MHNNRTLFCAFIQSFGEVLEIIVKKFVDMHKNKLSILKNLPKIILPIDFACDKCYNVINLVNRCFVDFVKNYYKTRQIRKKIFMEEFIS